MIIFLGYDERWCCPPCWSRLGKNARFAELQQLFLKQLHVSLGHGICLLECWLGIGGDFDIYCLALIGLEYVSEQLAVVFEDIM